MTTILIVTRPPEDERHPRTGGYMCDLCARHQRDVIVARGCRMVLRVCDDCVRAMVEAVPRLTPGSET